MVRIKVSKSSAAAAQKQSQPMAATGGSTAKTNVRAELEIFIGKYGGCPPTSSELGRRVAHAQSDLQDLLQDCPRLSAPTIKQATAFMKAAKKSKSLTAFGRWPKYMRSRVTLKSSELSRLLAASRFHPGRQHKRALRSTPLRKTHSSQYDQEVSTEGPVAVVCGTSPAAVGAEGAKASMDFPAAKRRRAAVAEHMAKECGNASIPYTPQFIVDWLYQATLDTVSVLEAVMGATRYASSGQPEGSGLGEVVLFWGSHLGSIRDQAMIAWDYDVDLAVFYHGHDFAETWNLAKNNLASMSHACAQHGSKFRVAPLKPAAWSPYQELYQQLREQNKGWSRGQLHTQASSLWRQGVRAKRPHGSNCIDIEVYHVRPGTPLRLMGSKPIRTPLRDIFPTAVGVFGPLQFSTPRTASMLFAEYGSDCVRKHRVKVKDKQNRTRDAMEISPTFRRATWPTTPLRNALAYLS